MSICHWFQLYHLYKQSLISLSRCSPSFTFITLLLDNSEHWVQELVEQEVIKSGAEVEFKMRLSSTISSHYLDKYRNLIHLVSDHVHTHPSIFPQHLGSESPSCWVILCWHPWQNCHIHYGLVLHQISSNMLRSGNWRLLLSPPCSEKLEIISHKYFDAFCTAHHMSLW